MLEVMFEEPFSTRRLFKADVGGVLHHKLHGFPVLSVLYAAETIVAF